MSGETALHKPMWDDYQQICVEQGIGYSSDDADLSDDELENMYD